MHQQDSIILTQEPVLLNLFAKAALKRGHHLSQDIVLPKLRLSMNGIKADSGRLRQYQKVCGFQDTRVLPPTYPQIMAFGAQMRLLTDQQFPLPLIGLVHLRNEITQHRPILPEEVLDFDCALGNQRLSDKGLEFEVHTQVRIAGRLVWESVATLLHRRPSGGSSRKRETSPPPAYEHRLFWALPADLGRRYARVSGDYNLIHLYPLTARLFGFKSAIAHGMWSKARCLAALLNTDHQGPIRVKVGFKLPILLPGEVDLVWRWQERCCTFELLGHQSGKPHLHGTLELLD